ncbi:MAG TPA: TFIIB-type zinc ribbon-containing protein [Methylomirabilota bacterium]|nr:TFIIB-type zinc ribbon-containing protein [Methylomirabilota bacterium]
MKALSNDECSVCGSDQIVTIPDSGEIVCEHCGAVISDKTEEKGPEWRSFATATAGREENDSNRTGMPFTLARSDMGLSTIIGRTNKDASGSKINSSMLSAIERLRTWDSRTQVYTSTDKNLTQAFVQLHTLKDKLGLPGAIIEKSAYIYRKAQENRLVLGRSISAVLVAAIYTACREMGIPRTLNDIATNSNVKRKSVAKCYRQLLLGLDLKIPMVDPIKCIARIANKAEISEKTKHQAINLMNTVMENEISAGKDPMGLAATVIYASCVRTGEIRTQKELANAADITDVTLRTRLKDLKHHLDFLN